MATEPKSRKKKLEKESVQTDVGRPTKYKKEYNDRAFKLALLGLTDAQMADCLDIAESTFHKWKKDYPLFSESINKAKNEADSEIVNSLYHRAKGMKVKETRMNGGGDEETPSYTEVTKELPPDTAAAFIWLKNRQGWKDKQEHDHSGEGLTFHMNYGGK
jgi:hypothetical protein